MCFDKADYYFGKAMKAYCQAYQKKEDALTGEDHDEIFRWAGSHIGFFLTWIIRKGFEGELHRELPEILEQVKTGRLLGVDFFLRYCDGKFWDEDLCPDILPFVVWYYDGGQYWEDYVEWVVNQLCDLPLEFVGSWEDYLQFEPVLDQAYQDYQDDMEG